MPNAAPRKPCRTPGCHDVSHDRGGRCLACRARQPKVSAAAQGYGHKWRMWRLGFLRRHPMCLLCPRLAEVPDHWPRSRRQLLAQGVRNPDQDRYCRPLCRSCHDKETGRNQPGGWAIEGTTNR